MISVVKFLLMTNKETREKQKKERQGLEKYNNQGCLMKIIEYNETRDVKIQFLDKYQYTTNTTWQNFERGGVNNPYHATVYEIGIKGSKYPAKIEGVMTKEYDAWHDMLRRCYDNKWKKEHPCYEDVTCCEEWLLFENFYEWLHSQENFDKWYNGNRWCVDKDILIKGNKIYSPETCCLVSHDVNTLFCKRDRDRGIYPLGVYYNKRINKYSVKLSLNISYGRKYERQLGSYPTPEDGFYLGYKPEKEKYIKQIAQEEYDKGNITEKCYNAMMNYEVEITD